MDAFLELIHQALNYLQTIKITDLIDIAIISYIFYKNFAVCKGNPGGSGAARDCVGGRHAVAVQCSESACPKLYPLKNGRAGLSGAHYCVSAGNQALPGTSGQWAVSLILPQLSLPGTELETAIDETVEAYSAMSKDKIGALMVFERNSILDTCLNSGTVLDAAVSSELLKNIFWPKAPMHDGRGGCAERTGCRGGLYAAPLRQHKDQPGTGHAAPCRHRGNGTYGCCGVICSEETGSISVAVNGVLKRHLAPETLSRLLKNELLTAEEEVTKKWSVKPSSWNFKGITDFFRGKKKGDSDDVG